MDLKLSEQSTKLNHHISTGLGQGKAQALLANVEFGVILAHEGITENPERTPGGWNVNGRERKKAKSFVWDCGLLLVELVLLASDREGKGELLIARHDVLPAKKRSGTQCFG